MKATNTHLKSAATCLAAAVLIFSMGCSKYENSGGPAEAHESEEVITDARLIAKIDQKIQNMPAISWYNTTMEKYIVIAPNTQTNKTNSNDSPIGFEKLFTVLFTDINPDNLPFSNRFVLKLDLTVVADNGLEFNFGEFSLDQEESSRGTASIGSTNLNLTNVLKTEYDSWSSGNDLIDIGGGFTWAPLNGSTISIGCDCNIHALTSENFEQPDMVFEYMRGLFYTSVPNDAYGRYEIGDWYAEEFLNESEETNKSYSWGYSFSPDSWNVFFSLRGEMNYRYQSIESRGIFYEAKIGVDYLGESESGSSNDLSYSKNVMGYGLVIP